MRVCVLNRHDVRMDENIFNFTWKENNNENSIKQQSFIIMLKFGKNVIFSLNILF